MTQRWLNSPLQLLLSSWRQMTLASLESQRSSQTVPYELLLQTSTVPSLSSRDNCPPLNSITSPFRHSVVNRTKPFTHLVTQCIFSMNIRYQKWGYGWSIYDGCYRNGWSIDDVLTAGGSISTVSDSAGTLVTTNGVGTVSMDITFIHTIPTLINVCRDEQHTM